MLEIIKLKHTVVNKRLIFFLFNSIQKKKQKKNDQQLPVQSRYSRLSIYHDCKATIDKRIHVSFLEFWTTTVIFQNHAELCVKADLLLNKNSTQVNA